MMDSGLDGRGRYLVHPRYENTFDPKGGLDRGDHRDGLMGHELRFHDRTRHHASRLLFCDAGWERIVASAHLPDRGWLPDTHLRVR
jgi:hypothetical protein